MPYAYTSPTAVESRPKSYSRIAPDVLLGSDNHAAMEEAREEAKTISSTDTETPESTQDGPELSS